MTAQAVDPSAVPRRFRFAAAGEGNPEEGGVRRFLDLARRAEAYGYDTFVVPDRLEPASVPFRHEVERPEPVDRQARAEVQRPAARSGKAVRALEVALLTH